MRKIVKYSLIIVALLLIFVGIPAMWASNKYNDLISEQEAVDAKWAQVEHMYQQRMHRIPSLVMSLHGVAPVECSELADLVESCTNCCLLDYATATDEQLAAYDYLQNEVTSSLYRLLDVAAASPAISDSIAGIRVRIEEQERNITHARFEFNEEAKHHNHHISHYPAAAVARLADMQPKPHFDK